MSAKPLSHRREQSIGIIGITPGFKTAEKRGADYRYRHALINGRIARNTFAFSP
jgi:hypothetical protein